ncbi:MAG TPA: DUF5615 family PIN-like protein [Pyrinomonadaceae bacterium]|nr:DUF5615 family PIN-like protein [Pyrinomonadaceae bacterium]
MKLKLDQKLQHDVDTVVAEGLSGADDRTVINAARSADRILLTLDRDFLDLDRYPPESHSGVVVFRPPRQGALAVAKFVLAFARSTDLRKYYRHTTVVERTRARVLDQP